MVKAQQTTSYIDPDTSIAFQQYLHSGTGFAFSIAFPEATSSDFIGQITAPTSKGDKAVTESSNSGSVLNYHAAGFGLWGVNATAARSSEFAAWAALASEAPTAPQPTVSGNSTTPGVPANVTTTISNVTYDYIVVGAGAAGIVVAQRLTEPGHSVHLLERGSPSYFSTGGKAIMDWNATVTQYDVPGMAYHLATAKDTSEYCTDTASQADCALGGSTIVNAMMYVKPRAADFDDS
ncbi:hypothetical protein ACHAPW_006929 [Verticillium nonalfalfae]